MSQDDVRRPQPPETVVAQIEAALRESSGKSRVVLTIDSLSAAPEVKTDPRIIK